MNSEASETTQLLLAWADGDVRALGALTPRVYRELRRILADAARERATAKHGGGLHRIEQTEVPTLPATKIVS